MGCIVDVLFDFGVWYGDWIVLVLLCDVVCIVVMLVVFCCGVVYVLLDLDVLM